jgi:hypothetical protein
MNTEFWSIVAQLSGTFLGLIFVALSIHLASIRAAVNAVEAEIHVEEQSSRLMFVSMLSSLYFFVLPLITSLSLLAQQSRSDKPNIVWLSLGVYLLLLFTLVGGCEHSRARQQVKLVLSERVRRSRRLLQWRVWHCKWLLYLLIPVNAVLLAAILVGQPPIPRAEDWLEVVTCLSMALGLSSGMLDLYLFDASNVLFRVSSRLQALVERIHHELQTVMQDVEWRYREYETISQSHGFQQELERLTHNPDIISILSPKRVHQMVQSEQARVHSLYKKFREEIPIESEAKLIQQFRARSKVVTYSDINSLKNQSTILLQDMEEFRDLLDRRLRSFQSLGIRPDPVSHNLAQGD